MKTLSNGASVQASNKEKIELKNKKNSSIKIVKNSTDKQTTISKMYTNAYLPDINDVIEEHGMFVFKFIAKRTWDSQIREDIYQSTIVEAIKSYKNFKGDSHPRTWLCGIAFNMIRNHAKSTKDAPVESIEEYKDTDTSLYCLSYGTEDPSEVYETTNKIEKVVDIFNRMPEEMKITINHVITHGNSYENTAAYLGVPIGTIRSRVARAREIFREHTKLH